MLRRLAHELPALRDFRGATAVVLALGCVLGIVLGRAIDSGASTSRTPPVPDAVASAPPGTSGGTRPPSPAAVRLRKALREGVVHATRKYGGTAEAAIWIGGDSGPVWYGDAETPHRMWSMSKAVTAIALEQETHGRVGPLTTEAITDAITRSDNCAQRALVGRLQDITGGRLNALESFDAVLGQSGAQLRKAPQESTMDGSGEPRCKPYVQSHGTSPDGKALLLGTAEWNLLDAIQFAHALGEGVYGAPGRTVLGLMRQPKLLPHITDPGDLTVPLDWGAGRAFAGLHPAYKGGWGGSGHKQYMAAQIVVVQIGGKSVAIAAVYHPSRQPALDDPGLTHSDRALELMFASARRALQ